MQYDMKHLLETMRAAPQYSGVAVLDVHDTNTGQRAVAVALVDLDSSTGASIGISPENCYQLAEMLMTAADAVMAEDEQARAMR